MKFQSLQSFQAYVENQSALASRKAASDKIRAEMEADLQKMRAHKELKASQPRYEALTFEVPAAGGRSHEIAILADKARTKLGRHICKGLVNVVVDGRAWLAGGAQGFERLAVGREVSFLCTETRERGYRSAWSFILPLQGALVMLKFVQTGQGAVEAGCALVNQVAGALQAQPLDPARGAA